MTTEIRRTHRHFVAIPLFALALLVPVAHGTLRGSVLKDAAPAATEVLEGVHAQVLPGGGRALLYDAATLAFDAEYPELRDGSGLFAADGLLRLSLGGDRSVTMIDGLTHLTRYDESIVVAALTTPVLVQIGERRTLIAPGRQWRTDGGVLPDDSAGVMLWLRSRNTSPVPRTTLQEQVRNSALLPLQPAETVHSSGSVDALLPLALPLLPGARDRVEAAHRDVLMNAVIAAVEARDGTRVDTLLSQGVLAASLHEFTVERELVQLLLRSGAHADTAAPIAAALSRDPDLWILLTVHPQVSAVSGVFAEPLLAGDHFLIDAFLLPSADVQSQALGDMAIRAWGARTEEALADMADPLAVLEPLLRELDRHIGVLLEQNYPERAHRLATAAIRIAEAYADALDPASAAVRDRWTRLDAVRIDVPTLRERDEPAAAVSAPQEMQIAAQSSSASAVHLDPTLVEAVLNRTIDALTQGGALFTMETNVIVTGTATADVQKLVISTPVRDRTFSFTINVDTNTVEKIVEAGIEYQYALSLEQFLQWAKGG